LLNCHKMSLIMQKNKGERYKKYVNLIKNEFLLVFNFLF